MRTLASLRASAVVAAPTTINCTEASPTNEAASAANCVANSRVGAKTSTDESVSRARYKVGTKNARVLPLPVSAASTADAPARNGSRATFWIGVGVWMFLCFSASWSDGARSGTSALKGAAAAGARRRARRGGACSARAALKRSSTIEKRMFYCVLAAISLLHIGAAV